MDVIYLEFEDYKKNNNPIVAAIGQFDGLHVAHLTLIKKTIDIAKENNLKSAIFTFDPHPDFVLKKDLSNAYVTPINEKINLLSNLGLDFMFVIKFDLNIASIEPYDFVNNILINNYVKEVVVGFDFSFGKFGKGKAKDITSLSNNIIKTTIIDEIKYNEEKIGTTLVKQYLKLGKVDEVYKLLGRYYKIKGTVVEGNKVGRTLNLPTANLKVDKQFANIKPGVYAVKVNIKNIEFYGFANLGYNPSFNESVDMVFETHIFNYSNNLYGETLEIELLSFIRDEIKFNSKEEFLNQINKDKENVHEYLKNILN